MSYDKLLSACVIMTNRVLSTFSIFSFSFFYNRTTIEHRKRGKEEEGEKKEDEDEEEEGKGGEGREEPGIEECFRDSVIRLVSLP